jgi:hypothetical protein
MPEEFEPLDRQVILSLRDRQNRYEQELHDLIDHMGLSSRFDTKNRRYVFRPKKNRPKSAILEERMPSKN